MKTNEKEKIITSFCNVLETMAFMFSEVIDKNDITDYPKDVIQAEMNFSGYKSGSLKLLVPIEMCLEISANTLGKDFDEALRMVKASDAVKELLNITCGKFLTELYGTEPVFDLTPPEVTFPGESVLKELIEDEESLFFLAEDSWTVGIKLKIYEYKKDKSSDC